MDIPLFSRQLPTLALRREIGSELKIGLPEYGLLLAESRDEIEAQLNWLKVPQRGPVAINARTPAHIIEKVRRLGHPVVLILDRREVYLLPGLLPAEQGSGLEEVWPALWVGHPWAVWATVR